MSKLEFIFYMYKNISLTLGHFRCFDSADIVVTAHELDFMFQHLLVVPPRPDFLLPENKIKNKPDQSILEINWKKPRDWSIQHDTEKSDFSPNKEMKRLTNCCRSKFTFEDKEERNGLWIQFMYWKPEPAESIKHRSCSKCILLLLGRLLKDKSQAVYFRQTFVLVFGI